MKFIEYYRTEKDKSPYLEWYNSLNKSLKLIVDKRIVKIKRGLYGDYKQLSNDLFEFRFHNGLRIYFAEKNDKITVFFLNAGNKSKQSKDIEKAEEYLADYKRRCKQND